MKFSTDFIKSKDIKSSQKYKDRGSDFAEIFLLEDLDHKKSNANRIDEIPKYQQKVIKTPIVPQK